MISKNLLMSALTSKFNMLTLHSIVNECFVNGLPINKDEITNDEKAALTKYSYDVLNRLGGFSVLENAIESNANSLSKSLLLGEIYQVCTEASKEASKRICSETDCKDKDTKLNNVVDKASFTEAEYKKFANKANGIGLDEIGKLIKDKTIAVIKDEQDQYEKEEALDDELKSALDESEDFSGTSTEAYVDMFLDKSAPRHHITVFSRLQEAAMEMMNIVKVENGEDAFPIVRKVTFESFVDGLKADMNSLDSVLESNHKISVEEVCDIPMENRGKMATLVSIIVYSVMETLKTMNLYCPSQNDVKSFVNKSSDKLKIANEDIQHILKKAEDAIQESAKQDFSKMKSAVLSTKLAKLKKTDEAVQESVNPGDTRVINILSALESQINDITQVLHARNMEIKDRAAATEGYYDTVDHKNDVAQFNRINYMFGKDPNIKSIRLEVDPDGISSAINVCCVNESNNVIRRSFINMRTTCEQSDYAKYISDLYKESKLSECDKPVTLMPKDGTGQMITL